MDVSFGRSMRGVYLEEKLLESGNTEQTFGHLRKGADANEISEYN